MHKITSLSLFSLFSLLSLVDSAALASPSTSAGQPLQSGILTKASNDAPEVVVRNYLQSSPSSSSSSTPLDIRFLSNRTLSDGNLVSVQQEFIGLPIVGAVSVAKVDAQNRLRWLRQNTVRIPKGFVTQPKLDKVMLKNSLLLAGYSDRQVAGSSAKLVVYALGENRKAPKLVWEVQFAPSLAPLEMLQLYVDAHSGSVLLSFDKVEHAKANVFPTNPVKSPDLEEVDLPHLKPGVSHIEDQNFDVYSCVDKRECVLGPDGGYGHFCSFVSRAVPDSSGNYTSYLPPENEQDWEDPFSEVSAYYHVRKALDFVRGRLHDPSLLSETKFTLLTNAPELEALGECTLDDSGEYRPSEESQFKPQANASFAPFHEMFPPPLNIPLMMFGQSETKDYSYSGDVVYHEFGHAVFHFIGQPGLGAKSVPDQYGTNPSQGAMNEGFADYLSSAITGDPILAEYIQEGGMRNLENSKTCPNDMTGEEHDDSEAWSGALWSIRSSVPASDYEKVDSAVLTTMMTITVNDTFRSVSEVLISELKNALGDEVAATALKEMTNRGFTDGCNNRTRLMGQEDSHQTLHINSGPAPIQFQVDFSVTMEKLEFIGVPASKDASLVLHLKKDNQILWDYTGDIPVSDAEQKLELKVDDKGVIAYEIEGPFLPGSYYLQLSSDEKTRVLYSTFSATPLEANGKSDCGDKDCEEETQEGGCNTSGSTTGLSYLLLFLFGFFSWRRKRA